MQQITIRKGNKYLLNYSGIEIEGILLLHISERSIYIFDIICPFTKVARKQSFIRMDILKNLTINYATHK